jgi:hypothetical protein
MKGQFRPIDDACGTSTFRLSGFWFGSKWEPSVPTRRRLSQFGLRLIQGPGLRYNRKAGIQGRFGDNEDGQEHSEKNFRDPRIGFRLSDRRFMFEEPAFGLLVCIESSELRTSLRAPTQKT